MRTQRTNGVTTYKYTYHGSQLTHMTRGSDSLHFYYDANGRPFSVEYRGVCYFYVTNLQGDVVATLDSTGVQVVGYTYDAWGNVLTTTGVGASSLGYLNPIRYRGYVYDEETKGLYVQAYPKIHICANGGNNHEKTKHGIFACRICHWITMENGPPPA